MKLKISYYLKTGNFKLIPVIALISFGYSELDTKTRKMVYKPLRYYTPLKLKSKSEWSVKTKLPLSKIHQQQLSVFAQSVQDSFDLMKLKKQPINPESFRNTLDVKLGKKVEVDRLRIRMVDFINDHILTSPKFELGTKNKYKLAIQNITGFEKRTGRPLYANDIDENTYKMFVEYIRSKEGVVKNNTVVAYMTYFNSILSKIARYYKIKLFKASKDLDKDDKIKATIEEKAYLSFEDIQKIMRYEPKTKRMQNVKLIFLTLLFTGCRFGDVFKIKPEHLYSKGKEKFHYCKFITDKLPKKEIIIPILEPLLNVFKKNKGTAQFTHLSDFDLMVKVLAKESGLTQRTSLTFTDANGTKKLSAKPLYDCISSHTGRRSFITNLINYIPITTLCKITAHEIKDQSIIFIYNKISLLENAVLFLRHLGRAKQDFKDSFPIKLI